MFEAQAAAGNGAFELDGQMVDAPVYKQVRFTHHGDHPDQVSLGNEDTGQGPGCSIAQPLNREALLVMDAFRAPSDKVGIGQICRAFWKRSLAFAECRNAQT